jgi:Rps23 Pro-64 3,4-dihydroxylase Tpa1-like proline 4-hydroxylase
VTGIFLPYRLFPNWLGADLSECLLHYAEDNEPRFKPSKLHGKNGENVASDRRVSSLLKDLGPYAEAVRHQALDMVPLLSDQLGVTRFAPDHVELELAAHGDGAVFFPHRDTLTGDAVAGTPRRITMVAYLFRQPKRFAGGQLRYLALSGAAFVDIEPEHNLLLAFPSIAPHAVQPVSCPGLAFRDWRFALNIWIHG